jgi:dTDP-4-amino-4,6-dideoxygalactose transaminase
VALAQWESRDRLAQIQTRNSAHLADTLARCDALNTLVDHNGQTAVHLFPLMVRVGSGDAAAAVLRARTHLHSRGIQTETPYPMLWDSTAQLPNARDLVTRMFLVPCNASLNMNVMKRISAGLEEASKIITQEFAMEVQE